MVQVDYLVPCCIALESLILNRVAIDSNASSAPSVTASKLVQRLRLISTAEARVRDYNVEDLLDGLAKSSTRSAKHILRLKQNAQYASVP